MNKLSLLLVLMAAPALAAEKCPWEKNDDFMIESLEELNAVPRELSVSEIRQDLECLEDLIKHGYVARKYYDGKGVKLLERIETFKRGLAAGMGQLELMDRLLALHDGAYDLHMRYELRSGGQTERRAQPRYVPYAVRLADSSWVASCEGFNITPSIGSDGDISKSRFVIQSNAPIPAIAQCKTLAGQAVPLPALPVLPNVLGPEASQFSYRYIENDGARTLYVRIPNYSFPGGIPATHQAFLDEISQLDDVPIVIDQRGGRGGAPKFAMEVAKRLGTEKDKLRLTQAKVQLGPVGMGGLANTMFIEWKTAEAAGDIATAESFKKSYESTHADYKRYSRIALGTKNSITLSQDYPGGKGLRKTRYGAPVVVLADKGCGSACEFFPAALASIVGKDLVTVIGTHTAGAIQFSSPGIFALPNSKILFRGGSFGLGFGKQSLVPAEGIGAAPDFYTVDIDGLDAALAFIRNKRR